MLNTDRSCVLQNKTALLSVWTVRGESLPHIACILFTAGLYLACFHLAAGPSLELCPLFFLVLWVFTLMGLSSSLLVNL